MQMHNEVSQSHIGCWQIAYSLQHSPCISDPHTVMTMHIASYTKCPTHPIQPAGLSRRRRSPRTVQSAVVGPPGLSTAPYLVPPDRLTLPYRRWSLTLPYRPLKLTLTTIYTQNRAPDPSPKWRGDHAQMPWTVRGTAFWGDHLIHDRPP